MEPDFQYMEAALTRAMLYCDPSTALSIDGALAACCGLQSTEDAIRTTAKLIAMDAARMKNRRGAEIREILGGGLLSRLRLEAVIARHSSGI